MNPNDTINFLRQKDYKFVKEIGQGGTGRTILIQDETINAVFVCKKYSTFYEDDQHKYYSYFVGEIKILHTIYHKNVVRVFNYYLYPELATGYILLEYIEGQNIEDYLLENPDKLEDVFVQLIDGFRYLEQNGILHRDVRPENILISNAGILKIIDFGFGKMIKFDDANKSISLNWRYTSPEEFENQTYDVKTELYFVGKLYEEILLKIGNVSFKYAKIVSKMVVREYGARVPSFFEVHRDIINTVSLENEFDNIQKVNYRGFAIALESIFGQIQNGAKYKENIDLIIRELENLYRKSMLEDLVQNNDKLTEIFVTGNYKYYREKKVKVSTLVLFLQLLQSVSEDKRKLILNNLWERLDAITRYDPQSVDDLPF